MPNLAQARLISLPSHPDARGVLTVLEANQDVPFSIKRIFYMYRVQPPYERGGHAHPATQQLLMCVAGSMRIDLSDGEETHIFSLTDPCQGLYIPSMTWTRLYDFTPDAVCLAAASTHYVNGDVIREWDEYLRRIRECP